MCNKLDPYNLSIEGLKKYVDTEFPNALRNLKFERPNDFILTDPESFGIDQWTIFFGGEDWDNIEDDLSSISPEKKEYFIICLFTIVLIDLTMYTCLKRHYRHFRNKTHYPKFGWTSFIPHFENPIKIILIPEKLGIVDFNFLRNNIDGYCDLLWAKCDEAFPDYVPGVSTRDFIQLFIEDSEFNIVPYDKESVFNLIREGFKSKVL